MNSFERELDEVLEEMVSPDVALQAARLLKKIAKKINPRPKVAVDGAGNVKIKHNGKVGSFDIAGAVTFLKKLEHGSSALI